MVVACEPDVVGYALAARSVDPALGWILSVAVEGSFRKRGIGRALVVETLRRCASRGMTRVRCTVAPGNLASERIWHALGFVEVAFDPAYFGAGEARHVLELSLGEVG
ncbi:GNAT family N-acetyltransferase [Actinoplanes sp. CA-030573]|uniref:GNAT family N-acetyltransferase n=1 Tax=Actinoplanes sp. CA-030573 TaxID=3239898 RepID=UPI003D8A12AB